MTFHLMTGTIIFGLASVILWWVVFWARQPGHVADDTDRRLMISAIVGTWVFAVWIYLSWLDGLLGPVR